MFALIFKVLNRWVCPQIPVWGSIGAGVKKYRACRHPIIETQSPWGGAKESPFNMLPGWLCHRTRKHWMEKGQHSFSNFSPRWVDLQSRGSQRTKAVTNTFIIIITLPNYPQSAYYMKGNCCSDAKLCLTVTPWTAACQAPLSSTVSRVCSNSYLLSQWCYLTISSSVFPFSSCPQSFPGIGSFPMSWLFVSDGQSIGTSVSTSVLPINIQGWFPLGLTHFSSVAQSCPCDPMNHSTPGLISNCWSLPNPMSIELVMPSNLSSSLITFSSCPQSFLASGSFQMSQLFSSDGQSIGISASVAVLPVNTQDWSPLGWTGWISLKFKGLPRVFSNTTVQKHQFFSTQLSL